MSKEIILNPRTLGAYYRRYRKKQDKNLKVAAADAHVGVRFLSEFERGKATVELGKVLGALDALGLELVVQPKPRKPQTGFAFEGVDFQLVEDQHAK